MTPNAEFTFSLQLFIYVLTLPVSWIPAVHTSILRYLWDFSNPMDATVKSVVFLLPALHLIVTLCVTMLAIYTIPFRSGRGPFIVALITAWWNSGRTIALYWLGFIRAAFPTLGWIWGFIRFVTGGIYLAVVKVLMLPLSIVKRATRSSLMPGIPWIAIGMTMLWIILEASLFSFTLLPTVSEIAADLGGVRSNNVLLQPALFFILFMLIAGSLPYMQVMVESIQTKNYKDTVQMAMVEIFVMFVEVVSLYRELADAITPALAQQSGGEV